MKRFLLLRLSSLGDIVLCTSVVKTLGKIYPDSEIFFLVKEQYKQLLDGLLPTNHILVFAESKGILRTRKEIQTLKARDISDFTILDLHNNLRTHLFTAGFGNVHRINKRQLERRKAIHNSNSHESHTIVDDYKILLETACPDKKISMEFPQIIPLQKQKTVQSRVLIHRGAKWALKKWPKKSFDELFEIFESKGYSPLFVSDTKESKNSIRTKTLEELKEVISTAQLFIGNDSGPSHMASALGIPSITLFGPTHPCLGFTPQGKFARYITKNFDCSPCTLHGKGKCKKNSTAQCLDAITPEQVFAFAQKEFELL